MNRQRLDAEAIRDSILAVSGVLLTTKGGPSLPLEYVENTGSLQPKGVNPPSFAPTKLRPSQEFERTIYLPVMRNGFKGPDRVRGFFDSINPAEIAGQRPQTVVPTQALFLLNNELLSKSAGSLAKTLTENFPNQSARLEELWLRAFGRPITAIEHEETLQFLKTLDPIVAGRPTPEWLKWKELCHGLLASNPFLYRL
jgi:hypothetical protein